MTPAVSNEPLIHIDCAGVSKEHGELLFTFTKNNPGTIYKFSDEDISFPIDTAGNKRTQEYYYTKRNTCYLSCNQKLNILFIGTISAFSSWGLGPDLSIKPDVSAPGGQIYST